jgi:hypothetical protein
MVRPIVTAALLLIPLQVSAQLQGSWTARFYGDRVELNVQTDLDGQNGRRGWSNYGRTIDASDFGGLSRTSGPVSFTLRRPAGTFTFEGRGSSSRASGSFDFEPNRAFAGDLRRLGFDGITDSQLFVFALENLTQQGARTLKGLLADEIDTDDLVRMINHGAGVTYVQDMTDLGFARLTSSDYTRARDHGVDPRFVRDMRDMGQRLTLSELIRSRDHGVTAEYMREMRESGFELSHEELVEARDHGVSAEFVKEMNALGYKVSARQLVNARDHGVSAEYVRELREFGFGDLPLADMVRMRDHGVTSDFIRSVKDLGYKDATVNQLVKMRDHGVTASYIRRALALFKERPTIEQLIKLRSSGAID